MPIVNPFPRVTPDPNAGHVNPRNTGGQRVTAWLASLKFSTVPTITGPDTYVSGGTGQRFGMYAPDPRASMARAYASTAGSNPPAAPSSRMEPARKWPPVRHPIGRSMPTTARTTPRLLSQPIVAPGKAAVTSPSLNRHYMAATGANPHAVSPAMVSGVARSVEAGEASVLPSSNGKTRAEAVASATGTVPAPGTSGFVAYCQSHRKKVAAVYGSWCSNHCQQCNQNAKGSGGGTGTGTAGGYDCSQYPAPGAAGYKAWCKKHGPECAACFPGGSSPAPCPPGQQLTNGVCATPLPEPTPSPTPGGNTCGVGQTYCGQDASGSPVCIPGGGICPGGQSACGNGLITCPDGSCAASAADCPSSTTGGYGGSGAGGTAGYGGYYTGTPGGSTVIQPQPTTGTTSSGSGWLILLAVAGIGITVYLYYRSKHKHGKTGEHETEHHEEAA